MEDPVVETRQGKLRGKRETTVDGFEYCSFSGIPYAKPPVGPLRFKDPEPADSWEGIRDAKIEGNASIQFNLLMMELVGSEDCLYLNVWTPKEAHEGHQLPVIVNIHGGGFVNGSGSANFLGPDYLVKENVIMVSINYRLGILGFLCTDNVNARGDMGLQDQNMALKWVNKNIHYFGGNPDNVTLLGISAGSASIEYQILSKKSEGLFQKAILQSGSVLNPWARTRGGVKMAERLAKKLGYAPNSSETLFEFLNKQEGFTLVGAANSLLNAEDLKSGFLFSFTPVINELEGYDGFVEGEPIELLEKGDFLKLPTLAGLCEKEGIGISIPYFAHEGSRNDLIQRQLYKYLPYYLKTIENLENSVKQVYQKKANDKNDDDDIIDFLSDVCFNGGVLYSLEQRLKHNSQNDNYFYHFLYDGTQNMLKILVKSQKVGACHGDDTTYIGPSVFVDKDKASPSDLKVRNNMVKMWASFAKVGIPTPVSVDDVKWLPTEKCNFKCLEIDEKLSMNTELRGQEARIKLWNAIYKNMNKQ